MTARAHPPRRTRAPKPDERMRLFRELKGKLMEATGRTTVSVLEHVKLWEAVDEHMEKNARPQRVAKVNPAEVRERLFFAALDRLGVPRPEAETRFHATRRWRLDYAWPDAKLGLEVEGGVWTRGKHGRGSGIVKDMEKANALAVLGWRLLRVTPSQLATMETAAMVKTALEALP